MRYAERKFARGNYGHPWSPTLEEAGRAIRYWKIRRSCILSGLGFPSSLELLRANTPANDTGSTFLPYGNARLKAAWKHLKGVHADAQHRRDDHLSQVADAYAEKHDVSAETALRVISRSKDDRYMLARIRRYLGGPRSGVINKMHVRRELPDYLTPDDDDFDPDLLDSPPKIWDTLYMGEDLFPAILNRNKEKLREAAPAPLAEGPLGRAIGSTGTGKGADDVLAGRLDLSQETRIPEARDILRLLKFPDNRPMMDATVTEESLRVAVIRNAKKTAASPSRRHPGHLWSALHRKKIFRVHAILAKLPPNYSFSTPRWENALDVMLENDPGSPKITRLRLLELLEYDMNRVNADIRGGCPERSGSKRKSYIVRCASIGSLGS